jgi:hypothetical protein
MTLSALRFFALVATAGVALAQPGRTAEISLSCIWQSHGPGHEKRSFEITIDPQNQRAQIGDVSSLPATISDTRISFAVNLSGSIFQYDIDRISGFGSITIKDEVMYSGLCQVAAPARRSP